ncbi:putative sugar transferase EpsL [Pseudoalteromonas sp. THAF3]|nr:putative sugar transferase EpsL [Pseudoalteromonas sp. THAF3]
MALKLGRPVIFSQVRPGLHGKPFKMFKFRSMTDGKDEHGELLSDEQRLTPFGAKLRATSLDELPELFNILKGDMSFVGPRPLLMQYLPLYNERQSKRHNVRPGLTGWAQINGRNDMSWQDKFEHDVWYVENQSLALDIKIMYQTLGKVIKSEGVVAEGQATTKFFEGNDK